MNVDIRVVPGAKKREIKRDGQGLKVKLVSQPQEGKANRELVGYLASTFSVRKSEVRIISGEKERRKVVFLPVDQDTLDAILGGFA
jgi:uncharacterized protein (TIGR00251 family)